MLEWIHTNRYFANPNGGFEPTLNRGIEITGSAASGRIQPTGRVINGFTRHAANQAISRRFKPADILRIVKQGTAIKAMGRYGPQIRYILGENTVVMNAQGKIITLFSSGPNGTFIP